MRWQERVERIMASLLAKVDTRLSTPFSDDELAFAYDKAKAVVDFVDSRSSKEWRLAQEERAGWQRTVKETLEENARLRERIAELEAETAEETLRRERWSEGCT